MILIKKHFTICYTFNAKRKKKRAAQPPNNAHCNAAQCFTENKKKMKRNIFFSQNIQKALK